MRGPWIAPNFGPGLALGGASNPLAGALADFSARSSSGYSLTAGRISTAIDQSGSGHNLTQGTANNRPIVGTALGPTGFDCFDCRTNAGVFPAGLANSNIGLASSAFWAFFVIRFGAANAYFMDGNTAFSAILYPFAADTLGLYQGINAPQIAGMALGQWYVIAAKIANAGSKMSVDAGSFTAGDSGASTVTGVEIGTGAGGGVAGNTLIDRVAFFPGTLSDAAATAIAAYLVTQTKFSSITARLMCIGDSITLGTPDVGGASVGGWRVQAKAQLPNVTFVGPFTNAGDHRGTSGQTVQAVAADTAGLRTTLITEITNATPTHLTMSWGINDVFVSRTSAQILADYATVIAAVLASFPALAGKITVDPILQPSDTVNYPPAVINAVNAGLSGLNARVGRTTSLATTASLHLSTLEYAIVGNERPVAWAAGMFA